MAARSVSILKTVNLGKGRKGLSTVGYTLYNTSGAESVARTTTGVNEVGSGTGIYAGEITIATSFKGSILWDSGQGDNTVYAAEEINSINGNVQYIRDMTAGKWQIVKDDSQMVFYTEDNATEVARYDLKDNDGSPSVSEVYIREKV